MNRLIFGLILLFASNTFYSQNCNNTISGSLKDFHNNEAIASATIYIKELDKYVVSDLDGFFKISNLCEGTLTLEISHVNCETKTITHKIPSTKNIDIFLEHHIEELNEVSVKGSTQKKVTNTSQETLIKKEALKKYSALSLGDALKEVPGVSSINTGSTIVKPMINGLHSSRVLIMNNNVRLQDQEWGVEHAPNIDINNAASISVIKGSGALKYGGDAIGGVIVIDKDRVILKDTLYGNTKIVGQSNGRGLTTTTQLQKYSESGWFVNSQATFKYIGDLEAPDYKLTNTGNRAQGLSIIGGKKTFESGFEVFYSYLKNEIGILRSAHIGNINDLVNSINRGEPFIINDFSYDIESPKQEVTHHTAKINYYKRFNNFGKVSLQYDYQDNRRLEFDIRRGENRNRAALDLSLKTHTINADAVIDKNDKYNINFGIVGRYQNNFANPGTGVRRLIPDYDKYDFGSYVTLDYNLTDKTLLDFGLRYDFNRIDAQKFYFRTRWEERGYDETFSNFVVNDENFGIEILTNPVFNFHNFSASVGFRHNFNANNKIIANYTLSSRPPNPAELFSDGLHHSAARIELGDLAITKETAHRLALGYSYSKNAFSFNLETYYNRINNFIYIEPTGIEQTIRGAFPVWSYIQTDAELYGLDVQLNYNLTNNLTLSNKSSFVIGNDLGRNRDLIDMPPFNTENTISYRNKDWKNLFVSLTSQLMFQQNRFPDNNFIINNPTTGEDVLVDISSTPDAYHLLHLYSEITFNTSKNTNLNVGISVNNILNTSYREYLNRLRFYADDIGRNIMLQIQFNY